MILENKNLLTPKNLDNVYGTISKLYKDIKITKTQTISQFLIYLVKNSENI